MTSRASAAMTWDIALMGYMSYLWLILFGYLRDFYRNFFPADKANSKTVPEKGYAPIVADFDDFYRRRLFLRVQDAFNRPIASAPSAWIDVWKRYTEDSMRSLTYVNFLQI